MLKRFLVLVIFLLSYTQTIAQSVDTAWVRRYNGPGNYDDGARVIAVDGSGNVYVTGQSVGNGTFHDYATIKYYANGNTAWMRRYNGTENGADFAYAMAVDGSGSVYVTGYSADSGTYNDYATIKYYSNGDTAWVRRYNGPGYIYDRSGAIAIDDSGSVYVTGYSEGTGTFGDYATIKYYSNGDTAWVRRYDGPGNGYDIAYAMVVDGSGSVYVTGSITGSGTFYDYATIKYYSNGDTAWVRRYNGPENLDDKANAIAVDGSGYVYVTGYSKGSGTFYDFATVKYNSNGDTAWVRRYNGPVNYDDRAYAIVVDDSGSVYVTGYSSGNFYDYATIKYYSNGDTAWVRRYNGPGNGDDWAFAITVDGSGSVCVTGWSEGSGTNYDYATIKYIQFLRGDVDHNRKVNVSDVVYLISYLFKGGPAPIPGIVVGDANCDRKVTIADVVYLVSYLFKFGPAPCQ